MSHIRKIELLAPAKDFETGIAAIDNGADAVYIGAAQFGARQAAGNSVEDIARLVNYAHIFGVKVYVTLNTIIYDDEIPAVESLVKELYGIGVDALITQDTALLKMNIPPIPLHASTQMDNCTADKVEFLSSVGFPRVVLARELSLDTIAEIHKSLPETELEVFVHGALCVSYSGRCYASEHCFGRSANRGACAQFCRLSFDLVDSTGETAVRDKYLLSLKDMNRSDYLEQILDAGAISLKIEGRLKDISYVKNITAYYRAKLDEIFARRKEYARASFGKTYTQFTPSPAKSFNRGFTDYMLLGTKDNIASPDTPKSIGEYICRVKFVSRNFFTITGGTFNNGDGACFIGRNGKLCGFRINKVEGNRVFPQTMPPVESGDELYRNYDCEAERAMSRSTLPRRMSLALSLTESNFGLRLQGIDESGVECCVDFPCKKELARSSQLENIKNQLSKWGNTPFVVEKIDVDLSDEWFIPSSQLSEMRRSLCDMLLEKHRVVVRECTRPVTENRPYITDSLDYKGNVANALARDFYKQHGVRDIAPAFELEAPKEVPVMFCKHCIKYSMGWCSKSGAKHSYKEPFYIVSGDGRRFRLHFNCKDCVMEVYGS